MAITETHVVSGVITTSVSGNVVGISGQSINVGSLPTISISGNVVNISGQQVQTSVSGNIVMLAQPAVVTPTVYIGIISGITWLSGGTQLPNIPCSKFVSLQNTLDISGFGNNAQYTVGGIGNNAPYYDVNLWPQRNGTDVDGPPAGITNLNQLSVVCQNSGTFGMLAYTTVD